MTVIEACVQHYNAALARGDFVPHMCMEFSWKYCHTQPKHIHGKQAALGTELCLGFNIRSCWRSLLSLLSVREALLWRERARQEYMSSDVDVGDDYV